VNGVAASRTAGSAQAGTWSAAVPIGLPVPAGGAVRFDVTALDGSGNNRSLSRLVDNDGIPSAAPAPALAPFGLDRSRATGDDLSNAFTSDFNNGITAGALTRNGWTMTLAPASAPPRPLLLVPGAFWPTSGWIHASIAGTGTTAIASACIGVVKQVRLDVIGERAAIACDPVTGTIAVKAMSAAPTIEVWKQLSPTLWLSVSLSTSAGISTGSPTTANPDNPEPIDGQVLSIDERGVASVIGTFQLAPGASLDVLVMPDRSGRDEQVRFHVLRGRVPVTMGGRTRVLAPGAPTTLPIDRGPR
jgi:hypothetical protein